jgi:hypothetical protein
MMSDITKADVLENASNIVALLSGGSEPCISETARVQALHHATMIIRALEKPEDGLIKFAYSVSHYMIAGCRSYASDLTRYTAIDLDVRPRVRAAQCV